MSEILTYLAANPGAAAGLGLAGIAATVCGAAMRLGGTSYWYGMASFVAGGSFPMIGDSITTMWGLLP